MGISLRKVGTAGVHQNGQKDTQQTVYDLTGEPVTNIPMMAGQATTRSHWEGTRRVYCWDLPPFDERSTRAGIIRLAAAISGRKRLGATGI
jgi:hypothetical protein